MGEEGTRSETGAGSDTEMCCGELSGRRESAAAEECSGKSGTGPAIPADPALCPVSGTIGRNVDLITVKALLNRSGLRRLDGEAYRFCDAPDCDVVYFDNRAGSVFRKGDLTVRVWQKETDESVPICYCFGYSMADVRRDLSTVGRTEIPATITNEVRSGHCACEVKNPQGSCCLGNVSISLSRIQLKIPTGLRS